MTVQLIESMGNDLSIVNAARVSFGKQSLEMTENDRGLISYLMRNRHGTPFEMVQFKFRIRTSIAVAREWQRHRIGSFNEMSSRYVEMGQDFYLPSGDAVRTQIGRPGHYQMIPMPGHNGKVALEVMREAYRIAFSSYETLLRLGMAKEVARLVLPMALITEFIWSVNLRSLFNFLSLRTAETALLEIRLEAKSVEAAAREIAPVAFGAWNDAGRVAP